jgi:hypothetical protein
VRRLATFVALILLLSGSAPILACMTGESMSASESACCRSMHGDCGDMAKTGCCRVEARSDDQPQTAASGPSVESPAIVAAPVWAPVAFRLAPAVSVLKMPDEHSPPGLIVVRISNLRI